MVCIALIAGIYQPDRCGVAHYTAHLRQSLAERDVPSLVLTTIAAEQQQAGPDPGIMGIVTHWHWRQLPALVQSIRQTSADLLHIQHAAGTYRFDRSIFLLPLLLRWAGWRAPIVTTIHEYGWWEWQPSLIPAAILEGLKQWGQGHGWWDREDGFLLTGSDALITTNEQAEQVILERLPQLGDRLHRIPIGANVDVAGVDPTQARRRVRERAGWGEDTQIIAFFGFLHPVKGLETLFRAVAQVVATHPGVRLLLVGGVESLALPGEQADRYWHQLHGTIAQLGLEQVVHLTGYLNATETSHCLAGADIGVLPFNHGVTLKSGSLLALLAHGLPVVATRSQPADPDLEWQDFLRFVPPRQADELAAALRTLLQEEDLGDRLGRAGREFSQRFSWSGIAHAHCQIYQQVLAQRR